MNYPTYEYTQNPKIPAYVQVGEKSTPVWIQQLWEDGEFSEYVRRNGCGHCCTAMVLNLHGVNIDPHEEYTLCRKRWGKPRMGEPLFEDNFLSGTGIAEILESFNVPAKTYGVPEGNVNAAAKHISDCLKDGKQVILWSHPSDKLPDNPFSSGEHWILAVGYMEDGQILVANSSQKAATDKGIQFTDIETIEKVLFEGSEPMDFTWGRYDLKHGGGYVVAEQKTLQTI